MLIILGIIILVLTWWDYERKEADTILLVDLIVWWTFSRAEHPYIFKAIILGQAALGLGCIIWGMFH